MKLKIILMGLLVVSALFDIVTFFKANLMEFEANPIYIMTGSVWVILLLKLSIVASVIYLLLKYKPIKTHTFAYALVFMTVSAILLQFLGGISNLVVEHKFENSEPGTVVPLEPQEATQAYTKFIAFFYFIPLILAIVSFLIFEKIYLRGVLEWQSQQ